MTSDRYDDPVVEKRWCAEQHARVEAYLLHENVQHGCIGEWPAWHIAPYVSIWAIESLKAPGWVGWWVISGDLPTDYVSAGTIKNPRDAMRAFAASWKEVSVYMRRGERHPDMTIGSPEKQFDLGDLLERRAGILADWAENETLWSE